MDRFHLNLKGQSTGRDKAKHRGLFARTKPSTTIPPTTTFASGTNCKFPQPDVPEALRINMDKLAAGILLTAQGVPFIHAGDEFLRSKNLNSNSYNDNDPRVNPIDWSLKAQAPGRF